MAKQNVDFHQPGTPWYCPACDRPYTTLAELQDHLKKARSEGDDIHIDVYELEGWDETPLEPS